MKQCLDNATALRVQGSIALDPVRGNCSREHWKEIDDAEAIESSPYQSEGIYERRERVKSHICIHRERVKSHLVMYNKIFTHIYYFALVPPYERCFLRLVDFCLVCFVACL